MATKILHELYQLCCEKRFRQNVVEKAQPISRQILHKYLIVSEECDLPPAVSDLLTETTDESSTVQQQQQPKPRLRSGA